jgi:hypothetical protein
MKILVLSALTAGATISAAQAQIKEGTTLLGGTIGYNSGETQNTYTNSASVPVLHATNKGSQVTFNPKAGFFIADNLAVGLDGLVSAGKSSFSQEVYNGVGQPVTVTGKESAKGWSLGPFVRYYHMVGEQFGFYGQLAGGYQHSTTEANNTPPQAESRTTKTTGGYANITPGAVYFLSSKFALELTMGSLGYEKTTMTAAYSSPSRSEQESTAKGFTASFGLRSLAVGASFYLSH